MMVIITIYLNFKNKEMDNKQIIEDIQKSFTHTIGKIERLGRLIMSSKQNNKKNQSTGVFKQCIREGTGLWTNYKCIGTYISNQ